MNIRNIRGAVASAFLSTLLAQAASASAQVIVIEQRPAPTVIQMGNTCDSNCLNSFATSLTAMGGLFRKKARPLTFHGYVCDAGSCAEHQAGYDWAHDHAIIDSADCPHPAREFTEGCWAEAGRNGPA